MFSFWIKHITLLVFDAYKKISGSDIEDSIKGEITGNLEDLLLAVGKTHFFCLPDAMTKTSTPS